MTLQSVNEAALRLPRQPLFGISWWYTGEAVEFAISHEDVARDTEWATSQLGATGLGYGDVLIPVAGPFEGGWIQPFSRAAGALRATVAHADRFAWDAGRVEMFTRRLPVRVLLGLPGEVASALVQRDLLANVAAVPVLLARPDAVSPLRAAGAACGVFALIGPAVALTTSTSPGAPLAYDTAEWRFEDDGAGELLVTTVGPRATRFERARTGVAGRAAGDGLVELHLPA
ncbi:MULTISPECIES: hypothetical protein [unclassified Pseudofrankia]|uniref:hypothetical protein n=1 Tax=unclassified Pseudofrankia TaxID=2994372 RepID=UPI0008DAD7BE|nr:MULTISPECIES: hypothetical protein [unclassified Pseudofrankia]MDT3441930.1 hypothetical protein [Pseudofrankia sp. BMG5.37]OHV44571.1 hypothetical protein BCD48_25270 [Pseudofrankia sp. BMG5.36]